MIDDDDCKRVLYTSVHDTLYNNTQWVAAVQQAVHDTIIRDGIRPVDSKITLIGHSKDKSSFYLKLFPEWNSVESPDYMGLSATGLREEMFMLHDDIEEYGALSAKYFVRDKHVKVVYDMTKQPWFSRLKEEHTFIIDYKKKWGDGQFNTVDSVVTLGGHILLVQRGGHPFKGSWALPGGFLNKDERIVDAAVRELNEETGLKVPKPVLYGSIDQHDVYDIPDRDPRGRIITHAYHFNMINYGSFDKGTIRLPKVQGQDDAKAARWFSLKEMEDMKNEMAADHYDIAKDLIGRSTRKWN
jgi:bifunctional NMN adenylyltransferase/nudix hydrolase